MRIHSLLHSRTLLACAIAATALVCVHLGLNLSAILCLAPALALGCLLYARRYPGERLLVALKHRREPRRPRAGITLRPRLSYQRPTARGGLLMALALAVRPPPAAPATS